MAKVITFSRYFPKGHPKEGQPTYFVEKFWKGLETVGYSEPLYFFDELRGLGSVISGEDYNHAWAKKHTIRNGKRFKEGEEFSPRVWSGKPYTSPQITIAPDVKIVKIYDYEYKIEPNKTEQWFINGTLVSESNTYMQEWFNTGLIEEIAKNDGLGLIDFLNWFTKPFDGQIICWADVNY